MPSKSTSRGEEDSGRGPQTVIKSEFEDDQALIDALRVVAHCLTTPTALDGLAPWQRHALTTARSQLDELAGWFADQRCSTSLP